MLNISFCKKFKTASNISIICFKERRKNIEKQKQTKFNFAKTFF